ncbi:hypothetical protein [Methylomonas sp. AM2-LC]|uniref:hypothetical protein n=1 Tax=Methylomonas sp. AM2-LC TaxID=3153301 RepID=UPI0032658523
MFDDILRIFDFLSPSRTEQRHQARKPMAIPVVDERLNAISHCQQIFKKLDTVEADVLNSIDDPEQAWPFLAKIRRLRRETQDDLLSLLPDGMMVLANETPNTFSPVRSVNTRTGAKLHVFNGGLVD